MDEFKIKERLFEEMRCNLHEAVRRGRQWVCYIYRDKLRESELQELDELFSYYCCGKKMQKENSSGHVRCDICLRVIVIVPN